MGQSAFRASLCQLRGRTVLNVALLRSRLAAHHLRVVHRNGSPCVNTRGNLLRPETNCRTIDGRYELSNKSASIV